MDGEKEMNELNSWSYFLNFDHVVRSRCFLSRNNYTSSTNPHTPGQQFSDHRWTIAWETTDAYLQQKYTLICFKVYDHAMFWGHFVFLLISFCAIPCPLNIRTRHGLILSLARFPGSETVNTFPSQFQEKGRSKCWRQIFIDHHHICEASMGMKGICAVVSALTFEICPCGWIKFDAIQQCDLTKMLQTRTRSIYVILQWYLIWKPFLDENKFSHLPFSVGSNRTSTCGSR